MIDFMNEEKNRGSFKCSICGCEITAGQAAWSGMCPPCDMGKTPKR